MKLHFVGISGSLRKASYNSALLRAAEQLLPNGITFEQAEIRDLPLYDPDIDAIERPVSAIQFREFLSNADAIIISSLEYNYSIPGVLKNAIDWASRGKDSPMVNKPVALMGATTGMWGTMRMQQAFRPIFQGLNMFPVNKPEVLVAQVQHKFDSNGTLIDEPTKEIVRQQMLALKNLTLQLRAIGD